MNLHYAQLKSNLHDMITVTASTLLVTSSGSSKLTASSLGASHSSEVSCECDSCHKGFALNTFSHPAGPRRDSHHYRYGDSTCVIFARQNVFTGETAGHNFGENLSMAYWYA